MSSIKNACSSASRDDASVIFVRVIITECTCVWGKILSTVFSTVITSVWDWRLLLLLEAFVWRIIILFLGGYCLVI